MDSIQDTNNNLVIGKGNIFITPSSVPYMEMLITEHAKKIKDLIKKEWWQYLKAEKLIYECNRMNMSNDFINKVKNILNE